MNIKPIGKRVLVEINKEQKTASGIIIPTNDRSTDEKPIKCKVISVSDHVKEVKVDDTVIINKYCGNTVERLSEFISHRIINISDIIAIIKD